MPSKKAILITGWTWYIGSHAVVAFEQAWYQTVIIDNLVNSSKDTLLGIEKILWYIPPFYECDIRDIKALEAIFQKHDFDAVIHFAGLKAVWWSCNDISLYHDNNIHGSTILFQVMQEYWVKNIIFSSSATVYAPTNIPPFHEEMQIAPTNPYATSKISVEYLLRDYVRHSAWNVIVLRYFNPIWAHSSGHIWEFPLWIPNNLMPYIMDVALWKRENISVFWNTYPTPDGTCIRDYIDIWDLIDAHILAYQKNEEGFHIFNVWTGKWVSVLEMIQTTKKALNRDIPYTIISPRSGDLSITYADNSKIVNQLGWIPRVPLEESIQNAYHYIKNKTLYQSTVKKPSVIHFSTYFLPHIWGTEHYVSGWINEYIQNWWEVAVVTFPYKNQELSHNKQPSSGYEVLYLPSLEPIEGFPIPNIFSFTFWKQIKRIKNINPDIIHTHTRFFLISLIGGMVARNIGAKWIHIEHSADTLFARTKILTFFGTIYDTLIGSFLLKKAKHIVAVNSACEKSLRDRFWVSNISVIYKWITPIKRTKEPSRSEISIAYVGWLRKIKRVHLLLEAFALISQKQEQYLYPVKLVIIGDWPELSSLKSTARELGIEKNTTFLWRVSHEKLLSEYYQQFHIFVNPSVQIGIPTTVLEAITAWNFVITAQTIGIRELLRYIPVVRVAPESTSALLWALDQLLRHPEDLFTPKSSHLFEWKTTVGMFLELYSRRE